MSNKKCNTKSLPIIIVALCAAAMLALYCSSFDLDNPIDPKFSYTLTVNASSGGTVSQTPEQESYAGGTEVTVTAVPNTDNGYVFAGWSGASTLRDATITVIMDENKTLTANFTPPTLIVSRNLEEAGDVMVTIGDDDPQDNPEGSLSVFPGTDISVTATSSRGYFFSNWTAVSGELPEGIDSTNSTISFNMDGNANINVNIMANFLSVFNPNIQYGSLTDSRDGQTYRTVEMPDGKTWMAENLNYRNPVWPYNDVPVSVGTPLDPGSWCYDNETVNCNIYGRLYNWMAAMEACPSGWRLPDTSDWRMLEQTAGGVTKLKSIIGWARNPYWGLVVGTNDFGFSALPGGGSYGVRPFSGITLGGLWWSSTIYIYDGYAFTLGMESSNETMWLNYNDVSAIHSVRCVKE